MKEIQEIFNELKEAKREQSEIRAEYKDALGQNQEYQELTEQLEELKLRKKELETISQSQMGSRWDQLDDLKMTVADLRQIQSDIAMTTLMEGKPIEVVDEYNNLYEPNFSVSFKKTSAKQLDEKPTSQEMATIAETPVKSEEIEQKEGMEAVPVIGDEEVKGEN
jgi:DNA repair exonuclease SbcCD ATPase subunit